MPVGAVFGLRGGLQSGPSPEFLERIAHEYGRGSGTYRSRVESECPDDSDEGLFRRPWLEAAAARWADPDWRQAQEREPLVVAVDLTRYGPDSTVVAVRQGMVLEEIVAWNRTDLMETVERLRETLERVGVRPAELSYEREPAVGLVVIDEVGLGAGVLDRIAELSYWADGFNGGSSAEVRERFMNARAESYWQLRKLLEVGEVALPPDQKLFDKLLAVRWSPTPEGKVRIDAKDQLKGRLGRSSDRANAVTMAFAESGSRCFMREPGDYGVTFSPDIERMYCW